LVEQPIRNRQVPGSSPGLGSSLPKTHSSLAGCPCAQVNPVWTFDRPQYKLLAMVAAPTTGGKILIVDDSKAVRDAIRFLVEKQEGFTVCDEAVDGFDAIEKAQNLKPDLILLDLSMPKLNGAVAASVLKATIPGIRIILFTMYEDAVSMLRPALAVDLVLTKPNGLRNLVQSMQEVLGRES
jgi:CheY-like chemotaxis protein